MSIRSTQCLAVLVMLAANDDHCLDALIKQGTILILFII